MFLNNYAPQLQPADGVLYKYFLRITEPVAAQFSFTYGVITFLLLYLQAVGFNTIVNNLRLHRRSNYLTGMSYLLITSVFSEWFHLSAPLIVNGFMLWIWSRLCTLYNNPNPKITIFNIGMSTGMAAFIYFPSVIFLVFIMAGIAIARPFRLQEWVICFMGIITPVYFFFALLFLTDNLHTFHFPGVRFSYPHFFKNLWAYAALLLIFAVAGIGTYFININMRRQIVQTRKSWQLLFLYIFIAAFVPFINAGLNFSYWILLALPVAPVVASAFLYPTKKIVPLIMHWALFAIYIAVGYFFK